MELNIREILQNCYKNVCYASSASHFIDNRLAVVPSLQAYSCFIMPRRIECVRCSKSLEYKGYKRHLLTCNGSGRFCPICCTDIALEGLALTEHLINCQRKTLVFASSLKISIFFTFPIFIALFIRILKTTSDQSL